MNRGGKMDIPKDYRYFIVRILDQTPEITAVCRLDTDDLERFLQRCTRLSFKRCRRALQRKHFDGQLYDWQKQQVAGRVYEAPGLWEVC